MKCFKLFGVRIIFFFFFLFFVWGSGVYAENTSPVINLDSNNYDDWNGKSGISPRFETVFPVKGDPIYIADKDAVITDSEGDNITWLKATITNDSAVRANDVLTADTTGTNITASYDSSNGILTMTGTDSAANYQKVLRTITFKNPSETTDQTERIIMFKASDGTIESSEVTSNVKILEFAGTFQEDKEPVTLMTGFQILDTESDTLASAKITIVNVKLYDELTADVSGTSIASSYGNGILTLTGEDTIANYVKVLSDKMTFQNTSQNPDETNRIVYIVINDGFSDSNPVGFLVAVVSVNAAPVNTIPGTQTTAKNTALIFSSANNNLISVSDADAGDSNIQVKINADYGTLNASEDSEAQISSDGTSDITISGTVAQVNEALNGLTYTPKTDWSGAAKLKIITNDMGNGGITEASGDTDTLTVNVGSGEQPTDPDAPVANAGADQSVEEGDTVTLDGKDSSDTDGDIASYQWVQTSGTSVTILNSTQKIATFTAPDIEEDQITLIFSLTVKDDDGLQNTDSVTVKVNAEGMISFTTATGKTIWLKPGTGTSITSTAVAYSSISGTDKPDDMIYGLIETEMKVSTSGDTGTLTIYLPESAPAGYHWYRYYNSKWSYYDDSVFNSDRTQVTLTIKDGGTTDNDGAANGYIKDLSGLGKPKGTSSDPDDSDGEDGEDTNSCFISTVINRSL